MRMTAIFLHVLLLLLASSTSLRLVPRVLRRTSKPSFQRHNYRALDVPEDDSTKSVLANRMRVLSPFVQEETVTPLPLVATNDDTSRPEAWRKQKRSKLWLGMKKEKNEKQQSTELLTEEKLDLSVVTQEKQLAEQQRQAPRKQTPQEERYTVTDAHQLRAKVFDEGLELKKLDICLSSSNQTTPADLLLNHDVIQLIVARFKAGSTPGNRARGDTSRLALSLEGGGMRGAVSAGMAAAITCLGLTDTFDAIYGSSAGSVIGAYMISRQMCMDVYVDILPAAKRTFVCIKRMLRALAVNAVDLILSQMKDDLPRLGSITVPGMNISFVLDGVMHDKHGIRPLDLARFRENDKLQPLRVASSYVENGKLKTKCFGTDDFFCPENSVKRADGVRHGVYACLEASMTVPGATGPPVLIETADKQVHPFFDAFCFEPLPYRSAVEEGATHVLVLCSRPDGFQPKSKPGIYELGVAPLYFRSHGLPNVARFFERGGQQYIYAEDLLTLEEGKKAIGTDGVLVPPSDILYGVDRDSQSEELAKNRDKWKKAHLLPLKVPLGTPELSTLEQDQENVIEAVRGGFAAAFDLLAPAIDLDLGNITGMDVAKLVFPSNTTTDDVLDKQLLVIGDAIMQYEQPRRRRRILLFRGLLHRLKSLRAKKDGDESLPATVQEKKKRDGIFHRMKRIRLSHRKSQDSLAPEDLKEQDLAEQLMTTLPGFKEGRLMHLSRGLQGLKAENSTVLLS